MIPWWTSIISLMVGVVFGVILVAVASANRGD